MNRGSGSKALWHGDAWPLTCCSEAQDGAFLAAQRDGKVVPPSHWAHKTRFGFGIKKGRILQAPEFVILVGTFL